MIVEPTRHPGLLSVTHTAIAATAYGRKRRDSNPRFTGKKIAFVSNRTGTYEIYFMNANGTGATQLTHGPEAHRASWGSHP